MKEIKHRSLCPLSATLDFFGDKWSLLIIRDIALYDKHTYGEFLNSDEKIATNILGDRLTKLENNGFISKHVGQDKKSKFDYLLTDKGISTIPLVVDIILFGTQLLPVGLESDFINTIRSDKENSIVQITVKHQKLIEEIGNV